MLDIFLQLMAIVPVLIVVCVSIFILRRHGLSRASTVSVHAGQHPRTAFLLALTILVAGTLYFLNVWLWVGQKYQLESISFIMLLAFIALLTLAFFPADKTHKKAARLHQLAGSVIVILMFILASLILLSPVDIGGAGKIAAAVFVIGALGMLALYVLNRRVRKEAFLLQASYAVLFYIFIILATFF